MTNLKKNIDHYMQIKGIKKYTQLLTNVAHEMGIKGSDAYSFVEKEKANFSKMLNGTRPLKREYIIPLESIFGVSLARILNEDSYKTPIDKNDIILIKGFRYYAYYDDPDLYNNEFDKILTVNGKSILTNSDEFGKTFLDYVVEYNSVNGVKYLYEQYGIKYTIFPNEFTFTKNAEGITWLNFDNSIEFARLVANMNDTKIFNDIFDSYYMFYYSGTYRSSIFNNNDYLEILMDHNDLFDNLFETKRYDYKIRSSREKRNTGKEIITYNSPNPIINNCLHYALDNLDKYKRQAVRMLKFGIKHNKGLINSNPGASFIAGDLGVFRNINDEEIKGFLIFVDKSRDYNDEEINALISNNSIRKKEEIINE